MTRSEHRAGAAVEDDKPDRRPDHGSADPPGPGPSLPSVAALVAAGQVRSVFQPIVALADGAVVAYEALARGPVGPLETPDRLFAAAREQDCLAELDAACRTAAFTGAVRLGLLAPLTVFVNVEPEVLDTAPLDDLLAIAAAAPGQLRIVLEITERALAARPADLLRTVERVRAAGWGVALDDVGAEVLSLAFMPLLQPDVVKLDLRLVQDRPGPAVAEIVNAVNAYAERSGALVLAEGIETERHLDMATSLGATLGQGWLFGRPTAQPVEQATAALRLPPPPPIDLHQLSPFSCLPEGTGLRRSTKRLLIELSKQLEREAMRVGKSSVVAATFQEARHFTPATVGRYRDLAERTGFVCALGEGLAVEPLPGVRGASLEPDDAIRGEWDIAVIGPHFAAALLARDLGDGGPDLDRRFDFAVTYDRDAVARAAVALLTRVAPRLPDVSVPFPEIARLSAPAVGPEQALPAAAETTVSAVRSGTRQLPRGWSTPTAMAGAPTSEALLRRALSATHSGVTIADSRRPDAPLIFVNRGFATLAGFPVEQLVGRNCRFLQGPDTDQAAVRRIREGIAADREVRELLLNYRGPQRQPWWNEVFLAPVVDEAGTLVQYIGVQNDVTDRVVAERALQLERDRATSYLSRIEQLARTDPLTELLNRRGLGERLEAALWEAKVDGSSLALLFVDLDRFKAVNDRLGHSAGDALLIEVAGRLRSRLRRGDLLARLGGDEFLVGLPGLPAAQAAVQAQRVAAELEAIVSSPIRLGSDTAEVGASVGVALFPQDGADFPALLHAADMRMYAAKRPIDLQA